MEDKKRLAVEHCKLIAELERLVELLDASSDSLSNSNTARERVLLRIDRLHREVDEEFQWHSPFS